MRIRLVFPLLCSLLLTCVLYGQSNRATITGTVTDTTGAVATGVEVLAKNIDTGIVTKAVTNGVGLYNIPNLPPGTYSVSFKKTGFKAVDYSHITLIEAQVANLSPVLTVGQVVETVTVTTDAPVLNTETATVATSMQANVVSDLPLNVSGGRFAEEFAVAITPGYSVSSNPWTAVVNGTQNFTKDFTVDGTTGSIEVQGDTIESGPTMEAVQEMQAQTSGLSASSASTGGGVIMFNLKSGTNQFRGSVFDYGHNEILDANTWSNDELGERKPKARFWDWGFSAGGPIIKNKTFVFGAFERYQQRDFTPGAFSSGATVPISDFLTGNFSKLLQTGTVLGTDKHGNTIYKGAIFNPADSGAVFVGNIIPSGSFSTVSSKIVALYQKYYTPENNSSVTDDLIENDRLPATNSPSQTPNSIVIKLDHNLRDKDRLSGSWVYNHRPRTLVDSGGVWEPGSEDGGPLANSRLQMIRSHEFRASESHTFTPTQLNVINLSYNWFYNASQTMNDTDWPSTLGFGETGAKNFPVMSFGSSINGYGETGIGNNWEGKTTSANFIAADQYSVTKGKHTFSAGGEFHVAGLNTTSGYGALTFDFLPTTTGASTSSYANEVGFGFASFLLGDVNTASEVTPSNLYGRRKSGTLFAQDDYKVTPKLTLNLGLRWDASGRYHEKYGHWTNFNLTKVDPNLGIKGALEYTMNGNDSFETEQRWTNFGPQIGIAWNPWTKVVFRGSFGITYIPIGIQYWEGVPYGFNSGFRGTNSVSSAFDWDSGYPGSYVAPTKSTTAYPYQTIASVAPDTLHAGYTDNINLGAQYQIDKDTRVEVSYVANRGHLLHDGSLYYNEANPTTFFNLMKAGTEWGWVYDSTSAGWYGVNYPYSGFSDYALNAISPYPQLGAAAYWMQWPNLYVVGLPKGQSYYDSMVVEVSRRAAANVSLDFSYVLSQQKGNTTDNFSESYGYGGIQDYTNLKEAAKTLTGYDQKHTFKGYVVYLLPFGRGQRFLSNVGPIVNETVKGWSLSGLVQYASGPPLTFNSDLLAAYGVWPAYSTLYTDYNLSGYSGSQFTPSKFKTSNRYFPTSVVSNPTWGSLGTGPARIDTLRGFGIKNENASLLKYFYMGHDNRYQLQFRLEFYNIFNRHTFSDPVTDLSSPYLGEVLSVAGTPRNGQFGLRFQW
ncbi:MAG: carboxypeptidase regulatory-like domain-containing protein [Terracidiphilus sp.]